MLTYLHDGKTFYLEYIVQDAAHIVEGKENVWPFPSLFLVFVLQILLLNVYL